MEQPDQSPLAEGVPLSETRWDGDDYDAEGIPAPTSRPSLILPGLGYGSPPIVRRVQNIPVGDIPPAWAGGRGPSIAEIVVKNEYRYATIGLILGGLVVLAGIAMILLNISGAIDLTIHVKDNEVKINTAVVGIVVAFVGAAIIYLTKPRLTFATP